jgi:F420-non-reducing hydrogenase iron-sulfur subunit
MKALRRSFLLANLLKEMGVEEGRFRLEWIAASESPRYAGVINEMSESVRKLGPMRRPQPQKEAVLV